MEIIAVIEDYYKNILILSIFISHKHNKILKIKSNDFFVLKHLIR